MPKFFALGFYPFLAQASGGVFGGPILSDRTYDPGPVISRNQPTEAYWGSVRLYPDTKGGHRDGRQVWTLQNNIPVAIMACVLELQSVERRSIGYHGRHLHYKTVLELPPYLRAGLHYTPCS